MLHELLDYALAEEAEGFESSTFRSDYLKFIIKCIETHDVKVHVPMLFPASGLGGGMMGALKKSNTVDH